MYAEHDPQPVVCRRDLTQLLAEVREPLPAQRWASPDGRTTSTGGRARAIWACEPLAIQVASDPAAHHAGPQMRWQVVDDRPTRVRSTSGAGGPGTIHPPHSVLYETFPASEARRIARRLEFHHPQARQLALRVLSRSCLNRTPRRGNSRQSQQGPIISKDFGLLGHNNGEDFAVHLQEMLHDGAFTATPHKWVVGRTLEWEFALPMPVNSAYQSKPSEATSPESATPKPAPQSKTDNPSGAKAKATQEAKRQGRQGVRRAEKPDPRAQAAPPPLGAGTPAESQGAWPVPKLLRTVHPGPDPLPHLRREAPGVRQAQGR